MPKLNGFDIYLNEKLMGKTFEFRIVDVQIFERLKFHKRQIQKEKTIHSLIFFIVLSRECIIKELSDFWSINITS